MSDFLHLYLIQRFCLFYGSRGRLSDSLFWFLNTYQLFLFTIYHNLRLMSCFFLALGG